MKGDDEMIRRGEAVEMLLAMRGPVDVPRTEKAVWLDEGIDRCIEELRALPAVTPGVKVKPLVWQEHDDGLWFAETIIGEYRVRFDDGWWWAELTEGLIYWEWTPENDPRSYSGPGAAMAACLKHYESKISTTVQPAPKVGALVEALVAEYFLDHPLENTDERIGRHSAVRGVAVRAGVYSEFDSALAAWEGRGNE
jgi:hypothetical protein